METLLAKLKSFSIKGEYLILCLVFLLFLIFPPLIRSVDTAAAPIDPGILSAFILSLLAVVLFKAATWLLIRMIWPILAIYSECSFETDFENLNPIQRVCIYLGFYSSLFTAFVFVLAALL